MSELTALTKTIEAYPFESEGGPLRLCVHWMELKDRIEQLEARLEISTDHDVDGIEARDETIKLLDDRIEQLEAEITGHKLGESFLKDRIAELKAENQRLKAALENTAHNIKHATPIAVCDGRCARYECVCPQERLNELEA